MRNHVLILYSERKEKYYIGHTHDLKLRLERHNHGWTKSTKAGIPWKIVYYETYETKSEAYKREIELKRLKSRKLIEKLISGN